MHFKNLLSRSKLYNIETFLRTGCDYLVEPPGGTYEERIREVEGKAGEFFRTRFPEIREHDKVTEFFYELAEVYQDVYFEIGLLLGAKIALQINRKIEELK